MMRLSTIAGIGVLIVSTAAIAQLGRAGPDRKNQPAGNQAAPATAPVANAMGNDMAGNTSNTTAPDTKTEPAAPPR